MGKERIILKERIFVMKIIPGSLIAFDQFPDRLERKKKEERGAGERKANR